MPVLKYDPRSLFDDLQREMMRWNPTSEESNVETSEWIPQVDVKEEQSRFVVLVDVPGMTAEQIDISMENGKLNLKGYRSSPAKEAKEGYTRVERSYGSFHRQFTLPDTADSENIAARIKHGVLTVEIPKKEEATTRSIKIESHD